MIKDATAIDKEKEKIKKDTVKSEREPNSVEKSRSWFARPQALALFTVLIALSCLKKDSQTPSPKTVIPEKPDPYTGNYIPRFKDFEGTGQNPKNPTPNSPGENFGLLLEEQETTLPDEATIQKFLKEIGLPKGRLIPYSAGTYHFEFKDSLEVNSKQLSAIFEFGGKHEIIIMPPTLQIPIPSPGARPVEGFFNKE